MPFGKTLQMLWWSRQNSWRTQPEWVQKDRDRSLRGKARIRARRAARRASKS